ncbi:MAG: hypothetical protein ACYDDO_10960 [Acidiferrobacterales bacterium]
MKIQIPAASILATLGAITSFGAQAAVLNTGDQLTINAPTYSSSTGNGSFVSGGSFFGIDSNGNGKIDKYEKAGLYMGSQGIIIGSTTAPGCLSCGRFNPAVCCGSCSLAYRRL